MFARLLSSSARCERTNTRKEAKTGDDEGDERSNAATDGGKCVQFTSGTVRAECGVDSRRRLARRTVRVEPLIEDIVAVVVAEVGVRCGMGTKGKLSQ